MAAQLLSERRGDVLLLTLSNPGQKNALGPDMYAAGIEALETATGDKEVRAVVITGADGVFCAGGNLNRLLSNRSQAKHVQAESIDQLNLWIEAIRTCPKPVLAAVEGPAAGAGFSLVLACDMVVAAQDAKFVMAYANVGLTPDGGSSWHLTNALPRALACELMMDGKPISAERLAHFGLVNRLVPHGQALDAALAWAESLAQRSPNAISAIKTLIGAAPQQDLPQHLSLERDSFVDALHHADGLEGISAFLEKRPTKFS